MNKVVVALLFLIIALAYGGYYYRDYFVTSEPLVETEAENNTDHVTLDPKEYGSNCIYGGACGDLAIISCQPEVDGPLYYVNKNSGDIVARCGGYCMTTDCTNTCPPKEWTCN